MKIDRFEDLEIWKEARSLAKEIYQITLQDSFSKDFRFVGQIRAASGSVMDNIVEGFSRGGTKEFSQFLSIANGSCGETRSQCYRAYDCEYITELQLNQLLEETDRLSRKIITLETYLKKTEIKGIKYYKPSTDKPSNE